MLKTLYIIFDKMLHNPRQILYYLRPQKILRIIYYFRHGGINEVSRILDERLLMGAELKLEIKPEKPWKGYVVSDYPVITFKEQSNPLVSIIIPAFNQFNLTYNCLLTILDNSGDVSYEIILGDDCSTDITSQAERIFKNIQYIRTPENYRFLKNCNYSAKKARGKYILFLNNDTQVQGNWLSSLTNLMEEHSNIGMAGSRLIYPDGRLQEAGGIIWKDGSAWNYGNGNNPALPEYNYVKEADYISGASIIIRRNLWEQIGGFDEQFAPAYCEDSDLAFSIRSIGYQVVYQPASVVIHFEGQSNGTDVHSGIKAYQLVNQKKFYCKWEKELIKDHLPNGTDVFLARDRSQRKKRILVIDHMIPRYDNDAGAKNVFMYIKIFQELGLKVTFFPADFFPSQPYTTELEQSGVEVLYGNYYVKYWKKWLADNTEYYDYIYLNRPHIAMRYMDILKQHTKGKIIYFGHDLHYLREQREYELEKKQELLKSSQKWKEIEFKLIKKADIAYVVGNYEKNILEKEFPLKPIRNIPIFIYDSLPPSQYGRWEERKNLMFVGSFNHPPNKDAVLWFATAIFPQILECYPDIYWYIIGSNPTKEILELQTEHIIVTGFVTDSELDEYYHSCRIAVVPLRYGAGVKGKVIEGIYKQCPLVTTPVGAEGISTDEGAFIVAETENSIAKEIIKLYNDKIRLQEIVDKGPEFINRYYTREKALSVILQDIKP